jgi:hypothetical protein
VAKTKKAAATEDAAAIRLDPPTNNPLVGETHTAIYALRDPDPGDVVTFSHPNGFNVRASVYNGEARGTFLVERPGPLTLGFRVNGKSVAEATFETR